MSRRRIRTGSLAWLLLASTGAHAQTPGPRIDNVRICTAFPGADAGVRIAACIGDLPATGGTADARGFEGAQAISRTIVLDRPVRLLLGAATFASTAAPTFRIDVGHVVIQGLSRETTTIVHAAGSGPVILGRGPGTALAAGVDMTQLADFTIDVSANASAISLIDFQQGSNNASITRLRFKPNNATVDGLVIRGRCPSPATGLTCAAGTANGMQFSNVIEKLDTPIDAVGRASGAMVNLAGADLADAQANTNIVRDSYTRQWSTGVRIHGQGNTVANSVFEAESIGVTIEGGNSVSNLSIGNYFDDTVGTHFSLTAAAGAGSNLVASIGDVGVTGQSSFVDANPNPNGGPRYSVWNGRFQQINQLAIVPYTSDLTEAQIFNPGNSGFLAIRGSSGLLAPTIFLAGRDFRGNVVPVSNNGGVGLAIANQPGAEFRVSRADGSGGFVLVSSIDTNGNTRLGSGGSSGGGYVDVNRVASPQAPSPGYMRLWFRDDDEGRLYYQDGSGARYGPMANLAGVVEWTPPAPAAVPGEVSTTLPVAGAAIGDVVTVGTPGDLGPGQSVSAWVSGVNTVRIRITQVSGPAARPPAGVYKAYVWK